VIEAEDLVVAASIKDGAQGSTLGDGIKLVDEKIIGTRSGLPLLSEPLQAFPQVQNHSLCFVLAGQGSRFLCKVVGFRMRDVEGHGGQQKKQVGEVLGKPIPSRVGTPVLAGVDTTHGLRGL
jgi:hypothetical protein